MTTYYCPLAVLPSIVPQERCAAAHARSGVPSPVAGLHKAASEKLPKRAKPHNTNLELFILG